jgi:lysine 6-dehydrogenase
LRVAVFGAGLMGSTIAKDLVKSKDVDQVAVYDADKFRLKTLVRAVQSSKLSVKIHDVRHISRTVKLLRRADVGVGALPHGLSEYAIESTLRASVSFVDLIFGWRFQQSRINSIARRKGITIIPACGLAPGLTNLLVMDAVEAMDRVVEVHIKVGGIPEAPKPPLNYRIVFSFEAVLEEYLRRARIVKNGRVIDVPALSGLEPISFPPPIGECECFYTDGLSTLTQTVKGVEEMDEKTIRWPGHVAEIRTLIECGLLDEKPVNYDGKAIVPRKFMAQTLSEKIKLGKERDLTLLQIDVKGKASGRNLHKRYLMIDHYDIKSRTTSMARTTAYPCSIAAQLVGLGTVAAKGLIPPELAFRHELRARILNYLGKRGIKISTRVV